MGEICNFQRNILSDDLLQDLKAFQIEVEKLWAQYEGDNEILEYEIELKNCFDETMVKMIRGYHWNEEMIDRYFDEVSTFPDDPEDLLFVILAFTYLVEKDFKILEKPSQEIEDMVCIVLNLEAFPNEYFYLIHLYFDERIQVFFHQNGLSSPYKQFVFEEAICLEENSLSNGELIEIMKKTPSFQIMKKSARILNKTILNLDQFYQKLKKDILHIQQLDEEVISEDIYDRLENILLIKQFPLEQQSTYLTEINDLDNAELPYLEKINFILNITDTFLDNNGLVKRKRKEYF